MDQKPILFMFAFALIYQASFFGLRAIKDRDMTSYTIGIFISMAAGMIFWLSIFGEYWVRQ